MSLRWQPPKRRLTVTGTTGTRYLYSTGQALTVQMWSSSHLPRGGQHMITLYRMGTEWFLLSSFGKGIHSSFHCFLQCSHFFLFGFSFCCNYWIVRQSGFALFLFFFLSLSLKSNHLSWSFPM